MNLDDCRKGARTVNDREGRPGQNGRPVEAKLLVVDDEPNIVELLSASLRYAGFAVATATSGVDAVNSARRDRPDLVLLDVMLPDMDGFDVLRKLRTGADRVPGRVPDRP
jgi:two-component system OmpR family response regulator